MSNMSIEYFDLTKFLPTPTARISAAFTVNNCILNMVFVCSTKNENLKMEFQSNFQNLNTKDLQSIEYFLNVVTNAREQNHPGENNQNVQKAITEAESILKDLGLKEGDYKASIRNILHELKKHFCFISSSTTCGISNGIEARISNNNGTPLLSSILPMGYLIQTGNSVIEGITRREILRAELESTVADVKVKNLELKKIKEDAKKILKEERKEAERKTELLLPERCETLAYTTEFYRTKLSNLKGSKSDKSESLNEFKVNIHELLKEFEHLKKDDKQLNQRLCQLSENGKLPPNISQAQAAIAKRKDYLNHVNQNITNFDESMNNSVFN